MAEKARTITVALEEPIEHKGKTYAELTFRRRRAKDLAAMDLVKGPTRQHLAMLASMADVPLQVLEDLDTDDFDRVAEETAILMGKSMSREMAALAAMMEKAVFTE